MDNFLEYHNYLKSASKLGYLYKKYFLHKFLLKLTGPSFLDVGCGIGKILELGSNDCLGIDINEFNVNYIKSKGLKAKVIPNTNVFPIEDSSFSSILCDQVLEHIEEPTILISEMDRVSKYTGKIIIGLPLEKGYKADPDHCKFYTPKSAIQLIEKDTNLKHKKTIFYPFPLKIFGKFFRQQFFYLVFEKVNE